jgi:hypothetical protein
MKKINATKKGLITAGAMILSALVFFYVLKKPVASPFQYIVFSIYTLGIIWSMIDFSRSANTATKFGSYFSNGFKTFIVITLLMVVYTFIFYKFNPQIRDEFIQLNNQALSKQLNRTPAEIADNANQMKSIFMPMTLMVTLLMYLFLGSLVTAVSGGFLMQRTKAQ